MDKDIQYRVSGIINGNSCLIAVSKVVYSQVQVLTIQVANVRITKSAKTRRLMQSCGKKDCGQNDIDIKMGSMPGMPRKNTGESV